MYVLQFSISNIIKQINAISKQLQIVLQKLFEMRKLRNNQREELIRAYKTPSPSSFADLKSPRFSRNGSNYHDPYRRLNEEDHKFTNYKQNQHFDAMKAYLLQRENTIQNEEEQSKLKKQSKIIKNDPNNADGKRVKSDYQPYNPYFYQNEDGIQGDKRVKINQPVVSRRSSTSRDAEDKGQNNKNSFQQTIRKLANESIRLRHECKVMQQKYEKAVLDKKTINQQNMSLRAQLDRVIKLNEQGARRQNNMVEEINNLKRIVTINSQELSQSNYQIYRMKQQLFELSIAKQKLRSKQKEKKIQKPPKSINFLSEKQLPQSKIEVTQCKACKKNTDSIVELTAKNEYLRMQLGQKTNIISSLCGEIQRIEGELKLLEKPRVMHKKYNSMLNDLNEELMLARAEYLSNKYIKIK